MSVTRWWVVAVVGLALAACSHSRKATTAAPPEPSAAAAQEGAAEEGGLDARCPGPMAMQGTKVVAEDAPSGAALTFTTTGDVDELRRRVHAMADMHNAHHGAMAGEPRAEPGAGAAEPGAGAAEPGAGAAEPRPETAEPGGATTDPHAGMMGGMHGGMGPMHGHMGDMHGGMAIPDSTASVEDVEGGARVYVTPKDPADLEDLRAAVRAHADRMQTAGCGMKSGTG